MGFLGEWFGEPALSMETLFKPEANGSKVFVKVTNEGSASAQRVWCQASVLGHALPEITIHDAELVDALGPNQYVSCTIKNLQKKLAKQLGDLDDLDLEIVVSVWAKNSPLIQTRTEFSWGNSQGDESDSLEFEEVANGSEVGEADSGEPEETPSTKSSRRNSSSPAPPSAMEVVENVETTFADVIGMDEAKQELSESVRLLANPKLQKMHDLPPVTGILLYGPPGTGKTFFARAAAGTFKRKFLRVDAAELQSKWHGESEKNIRNVFDFARKNAPCILFFDEFDAIAKDRSSYGEGAAWVASQVNQLLEQLDGITKSSKNQPIVIAATNNRELLDTAVIRAGRFDKHILVGLPDQTTRKLLLRAYCSKRGVAEDVDFDHCARELDGWSPAELRNLVDEAKRRIFRENPDSPRPLRQEDLRAAYLAVTAHRGKKHP